MNLLETVILYIFLVLFSMPSKSGTGDEVDTKNVESCGVEYGVEDMKTTRGLFLEETGPAAEPAAAEKVQKNDRTVVSRPAVSSSKPKLNKKAQLVPKPPSIIFPK